MDGGVFVEGLERFTNTPAMVSSCSIICRYQFRCGKKVWARRNRSFVGRFRLAQNLSWLWKRQWPFDRLSLSTHVDTQILGEHGAGSGVNAVLVLVEFEDPGAA